MASDTEERFPFEGGRGDDGRLIATTWRGYGCMICNGFHIELLDDQSHTFAALLVEAEDLIGLAHKLLEYAAVMGVDRGKAN